MGRVWRLGNVAFVSLLALVALLLVVARGADEAEAAPFSPSVSVGLPLAKSAPAAPAASNISTTYSWLVAPSPSRQFPGSFAGFTPPSWTMYAANPTDTTAAPTDAIPIGTTTGTATAFTTLGILNGTCNTFVPVFFPGSPLSTGLIDASTDTSAANTIAPGAGFAALIGNVDSGGAVPYPNGADTVMDGANRWNTLLTALLGTALPPGEPIERQVATANLIGTTVWVDIVTFSPGVRAPAALGYLTLIVVENFSPVLPMTPSFITDSCGLSTTVTETATVLAAGDHRANPAAPGTKLFFLNSGSDRDADLDPTVPVHVTPCPAPCAVVGTVTGTVNSDDTCPYSPNVGSPFNPFAAPAPGSGDVGEPAPGDGIDAACDPNPAVNNTPTAFGMDADGDIFNNRQDNCPLVTNASQADTSEIGFFGSATNPVDGGGSNDGIGNACDFNPHASDGHLHGGLSLAPVCITSLLPAGAPLPAGMPWYSDLDGDGWCNIEEAALGSNLGSPASSPEVLSVPTVCSDAKDNDGDGPIDLADPGCQLPLHDLAIRKVNGDTTIGGASECQPDPPAVTGCGYNIILRNNSSVDESGLVGVLVDPVRLPGPVLQHSTGGCSYPASPSGIQLHGGSANPSLVVSGPLNVDGDIDVEWLAKIKVTIPANSQATVNVGVHYFSCAAPVAPTPFDYAIVADLCHDSDIAPLGLFGLTSCGDGASDGGMDTNAANDAPVAKLIDDVNR